MPDEGSLSGTTKAVELATKAGEGETIIVLVSGGGSALLTLPVAGISLADKLAATKALVRAGASIQQLNTVLQRRYCGRFVVLRADVAWWYHTGP